MTPRTLICWYCHKVILGNAKRRYCNPTCRQAAWRAAHASSPALTSARYHVARTSTS